MKKKTHPNYREVVFVDSTSGYKLLTRSTVVTQEEIKWEDGKTYPMKRVDTTADSHPYFTGKRTLVDTQGRAEKFRKKYSKN